MLRFELTNRLFAHPAREADFIPLGRQNETVEALRTLLAFDERPPLPLEDRHRIFAPWVTLNERPQRILAERASADFVEIG